MKLLQGELLPPLLLVASAGAAEASSGSGDNGRGLIGFGIEMYQPVCAFACRAVVAPFPLLCSVTAHGGGGEAHLGKRHGGGTAMMTTPECRAHDVPFLTTLAACLAETCVRGPAGLGDEPVPAWRLERFWGRHCTGDAGVRPMWGYQRALAEGPDVPTQVFAPGVQAEGVVLNFTALVDMGAWRALRDTMAAFEYQEGQHSLYGIILLVAAVFTPVALTLAARLPFAGGLSSRLRPFLVWPSVFGTYHVRPLPYRLGNAPTAGQALYVAALAVLNVVVTASGYGATVRGNVWYGGPWQETMSYVSARTGVLAFALAPVVILLAGRNNFLLWLTDWSHETFLVLHRWTARLFGLQVLLHSVLELMVFADNGTLEDQQARPYWVWGAVATAAVVAMLVLSMLAFRRASYEAFLAVHVGLAVLVLVGSWYHVELLFERRWGYEAWLYATFAVWLADRTMRVMRVLKNGVRRAEVVEVAPGIVRVDVPGVRWDALRPGRHVYAFFPGLHPWTPWQNHPFSVVPTSMLRSRRDSLASSSQGPASRGPDRGSGVSGFSAVDGRDMEKASPRVHRVTASTTSGTSSSSSSSDSHDAAAVVSDHHPQGAEPAAGITLYIKRSKGMTRRLFPARACAPRGLLTLLDGPYRNNEASRVLRADRLLLVAGGIGVTGVLALAGCHANARLCWSLSEEAAGLARDVEHALAAVADRDVCVGSRLDVAALLDEEEAAGWARIGVVVCGPAGLCDHVRAAVAARGRIGGGGTVWDLEVDAFSW